MIYIHTTLEKFKAGKTLLRKHGGVVYEKTPTSGTLSLKMIFQQIVAEYTFERGEAVFKITKIPFCLTDSQVAEYLRKILG